MVSMTWRFGSVEDYGNNNEMYVEVADRETWTWFNECKDNDYLAYSNLTPQEQATLTDLCDGHQ